MFKKRKYKIVLYSRPWNMKEERDYQQHIGKGFWLTTERKYMDEAVAVVFHMPTLLQDDSILAKGMKKNGQLWAFWTMESEVNYEWQFQPGILSMFDITATYKLDSDVPVTYIYPYHCRRFRNKPGPKKGLVNAFISGNVDRSDRENYIRELMSYIDVHSYGRRLNNMPITRDKGPTTKHEIISKYKFSLAFENSIATDYVSEKFFGPLAMGSVPVYLGAPNVEDFAPGDNCYINAASFSSPKELAEYLLELDNNDDEYNKYLAWKKLPFREAFESKMAVSEKDPLLRLCEVIRRKLLL